MSKQKTIIYTDGSDFNWAFIAVRDDKEVATAKGSMEGVPATTDNDHTESRAVFEALKYATQNPGNYELITDSKSIYNKIKGIWKDHTGNADFAGIVKMIDDFNSSPQPISFQVKWKERLSNDWMKRVDAMASSS